MFGLVPFVSNNDLTSDLRREDSLFDRMMKVFDEPFMQGFHTPDFKVDVKDNGDSYDLTAELPGLKKEDIALNYKDNYLTISAQHEDSKDEKDDKGNYVRRERSTSSMSRSFYIDNIDDAKATASYENGVLSIHMPKSAETVDTGHTIDINSAA